MGVSKFVLKLRLYKDEQKSEIFCSSFESASCSLPFFIFSFALNKKKGHSSSRSSENKRPFGFSLCY